MGTEFEELVVGSWEGIWMSPFSRDWEYSITLQLEISDGQVTGTNLWKLVKYPEGGKDYGSGKTATEFLSGTYNAELRVVELEGTSKEDPDEIISLDAYKFTRSEDGSSLSGNSKSNGDWDVGFPNAPSPLFFFVTKHETVG